MGHQILKEKNDLSRFQQMDIKSGFASAGLAMGTLVTQNVYAPELQAKKAVTEALKLIDRLEGMMSFFDSDSQVSQINQQAGKTWVTVDPELLMVLKESKRYCPLTGGLFTVTIAPLISLWQQYGKIPEIPPPSLIEKVLPSISSENILINEEERKVKLLGEGQKIDLGGIAKGYAANQVIQLYRKKGIPSAMVNLGGHVALLGNRYDGRPWQVGIQNPDGDRGQCLAVVAASDTSVVTSGNYERFFLPNNPRFHHILHPFTGYPAESGLRSVTVLHPDSLLADVVTTAFFIAGLEKGMSILHHFKVLDFIIIDQDRNIYLSRSLVNQFKLIEKGYSLFLC